MNKKVKAKINLFSILRNIVDLCEMDSVSSEAIKGVNLKVQFIVPEVGKGTLAFKDGHATFIKGDTSAGLKLWFTSAEHFNKLIDGENTIPMFINVFKVGFLLKGFMTLADRLNYYLRPEAGMLDDATSDYFVKSTYLTANAAFYALAEIGNADKKGIAVAKSMPDGDVQLRVPGTDLALYVSVKDHKLSVSKGESDNPRAILEFKTIETLSGILNGTKDVFSCNGAGEFSLRGFLGLLDGFNKLLSMVGFYLR